MEVMVDGSSVNQALILLLPVIVAGLAWYIWCAIALAAVFAKSGEPAWKAWVPILNLVEFLRLGSVSGWWVLLLLVPGVGGVILWILSIVAAHRIGLSFGFGGGMTVLAALLFPVWATIVGFGSARWIGREGRRRTADVGSAEPSDDDELDLLAVFAAPERSHGTPAPPPPPPSAAVSPFAPPAPPEAPAPPVAADEDPAPPAPPAPAEEESAEGEPPSDVRPPAALFAPPAAASRPPQTGATGLSVTDDRIDEVTDAVPGAPLPIPASADRGRYDDAPLFPPVQDDEHWAASESFPEVSGAVSAIVGAPVAGSPRRASSAVSASADEDGDFDATLLAHRNRPRWSLFVGEGPDIDLRSQVVLIGRRPAPDPAHPGAQLISVEDATVSKSHARLELRGEDWYVTDLGSTNGVVVVSATGTEIEVSPGGQAPLHERALLGDLEIRVVRASR